MNNLEQFENYKPIKINSHKPFKVKKNILKHLNTFQKQIKIAKKKLQDEKSMKNRTEINKDLNSFYKRIKDLNFKRLKQAEYFKSQPIDEGRENYKTLKFYWTIPCDDKLEDALVTLFKHNTHSNNIVETINDALGFAKDIRDKIKNEPFVYFRADIVADFKEDKIVNSWFHWWHFGDVYKKDLDKLGYVYAGEINTTPEEIEIKSDANKYNL